MERGVFMTKLLGFAAAAATALTLGMSFAAPASAALVLAAGEQDCDLYGSEGCLFTFDNGDGNIFDDPQAFEDAYNAAHLANPPPEDLPNLILLGKAEDDQGQGDVNFTDNGTSWIFTNLPWEVSFYTIKASAGQVLLFGLDPAADAFTATNLVIKNRKGNTQDISHVTFFGTDGGGGGNEVPEPSTWALMILGFGSAGAMLRRRRTVVA
jgi:hypothetical protein